MTTIRSGQAPSDTSDPTHATPRTPATGDTRRGPLDLLGLSTAEQALYEEMIARPSVTATDLDEIATELGWSSDQVKAALSRLRELRLVTRLDTNPPCHTVTPPYNALNARLDTAGHGLTRAHQRMLDLATRFHTRRADRDAGVRDRTDHTHAVAATEHSDGADPLITVVRGREAIIGLLEGANRGIQHEILLLDSPPYFGDPHQGNVVRNDDHMAGVTFQAIYDPRALAVPEVVFGLLLSERPAGHSFRMAEVPVKLALIDGRLGLLPLVREDRPIEAFLVIRDPALVAVLRALFHLYWEHATPVRLRGETTTHELPTQDRELLLLLVSGHTDRVIAERLGTHERTVRRRVADLMRRIGADTRFQAGYRAIADGWIEFDAATSATLVDGPSNADTRPAPDTGAEPDRTPDDVERP